ncbi:MAG TPA: ISL3 family transposase, partial [Anaerolineae bacterium]|nr:ISL3 family transposase [Anaerolineae bacterium]
MNELIFPPEASLKIEDIRKVNQHIDIYVRSQQSEASCPACQTVSSYIHGRYWRHPQDLPWIGLTVQLHLEVRRFACRNEGCARKTFTAGLTEFLAPRARRTSRLKEHHLATAQALGGEAGRRLAYQLGMPLSGDTLIREIRQAPEPPTVSVRVVGVDDWAMKKGHRYGTILVDLEQHRPIDLLGSREADEVAAWLRAHPEIEMVSRDRGKEFIKAATEGAPQAEQVADRWHLLANLREAVVTFLQHKPVCLQAAAQDAETNRPEEALMPTDQPESSPTSEPVESPSPSPPVQAEEKRPLTQVEQEQAARRARRQERFEQVRQLKQAGYSDRAIGRHMKMATQTVRKYIEAESCPHYPAGRVSPSQLTPWLPDLEQRWQAGCTNASQLWREIQQQGFSGSLGLVIRWAASQRNLLPPPNRYRRQQPEAVQPALARQLQPVPWSAGRASWLIILDEDKLDDDERAARSRMLAAADTQLATVDRLARQFIQLVKERRGHDLDQWLKDVAGSGIKALQSFAQGLRADLAAV